MWVRVGLGEFLINIVLGGFLIVLLVLSVVATIWVTYSMLAEMGIVECARCGCG